MQNGSDAFFVQFVKLVWVFERTGPIKLFAYLSQNHFVEDAFVNDYSLSQVVNVSYPSLLLSSFAIEIQDTSRESLTLCCLTPPTIAVVETLEASGNSETYHLVARYLRFTQTSRTAFGQRHKLFMESSLNWLHRLPLFPGTQFFYIASNTVEIVWLPFRMDSQTKSNMLFIPLSS